MKKMEKLPSERTQRLGRFFSIVGPVIRPKITGGMAKSAFDQEIAYRAGNQHEENIIHYGSYRKYPRNRTQR